MKYIVKSLYIKSNRESRKTARLCGFCAFCLLLGGSTAVRHRLAKYKIQLTFLAVSQRVRLYNLLPLHFFDTLKAPAVPELLLCKTYLLICLEYLATYTVRMIMHSAVGT